MPRIVRSRVVAGVLGAALGALAYVWLLRPWYRNWGATAEEIAREMPLDERVVEPNSVTTRGISIRAEPDHIWPWIAQMGETPRGGFYSYTFIDRMQGMEVANAGRILPEYQTLRVGDALDRQGDMRVLAVEPGSYVVLGPGEPPDWLHCTWAICIYQLAGGETRLVTRVRASMSVTGMLRAMPPATWPLWLLIDPGVFIRNAKCCWRSSAMRKASL